MPTIATTETKYTLICIGWGHCLCRHDLVECIWARQVTSSGMHARGRYKQYPTQTQALWWSSESMHAENRWPKNNVLTHLHQMWSLSLAWPSRGVFMFEPTHSNKINETIIKVRPRTRTMVSKWVLLIRRTAHLQFHANLMSSKMTSWFKEKSVEVSKLSSFKFSPFSIKLSLSNGDYARLLTH